MVQLTESDIRTGEVLDWKGVHLFHFQGSSCSQKTRIVLNLKGIDWESHPVDLPKSENLGDWYLGINPRGLVPTLVIDGEVHIESNDIICLIDQRFRNPSLIPEGSKKEMAQRLRREDDLHLDLRTITFRYTQSRGPAPKPKEALVNYRIGGSGTVRGQPDPNKAMEIDFWDRITRDGITDEAIQNSVARFRREFEELDRQLARSPFILGNNVTLIDIAWFIYVNRLTICGYPFGRLHPHLSSWFAQLRARPEFAREIKMAPGIQKAIDENHQRQRDANATLIDVAGL